MKWGGGTCGISWQGGPTPHTQRLRKWSCRKRAVRGTGCSATGDFCGMLRHIRPRQRWSTRAESETMRSLPCATPRRGCRYIGNTRVLALPGQEKPLLVVLQPYRVYRIKRNSPLIGSALSWVYYYLWQILLLQNIAMEYKNIQNQNRRPRTFWFSNKMIYLSLGDRIWPSSSFSSRAISSKKIGCHNGNFWSWFIQSEVWRAVMLKRPYCVLIFVAIRGFSSNSCDFSGSRIEIS